MPSGASESGYEVISRNAREKPYVVFVSHVGAPVGRYVRPRSGLGFVGASEGEAAQSGPSEVLGK